MPPRHPRILLVFAALVMALLLMPVPIITRQGAALMDLAHAPLFGLVTLVAFFQLPPVLRSVPSAIVIGIVMTLASGLIELAQELTGRSSSWSDLWANVLGVTAALCLGLARESASTRRRGLLAASAVAALVVASVPGSVQLWDARRQKRDVPMIASFEDRLELSRWRFLSADGQLTPEHVTAGRLSLRIDLHAGKSPGVFMLWPPNDWREVHRGAGNASTGNSAPAAALVFDVWLSEGPPLDVVVKIVDLYHNYGHPSDRYERPTRVPAGTHRVSIPLDLIAHAPISRQMDLSQIRLLQFYIEMLDRPRTLFVDNIHLEGGSTDSAPGKKLQQRAAQRDFPRTRLASPPVCDNLETHSEVQGLASVPGPVRTRSTRQGALGVKKLGWKQSFSEIIVSLGRARRRVVSNNILQQSLAELRRTRPAGDESASPSDITLVDDTLVDGARHLPSAPQAPQAPQASPQPESF